MGDKPEGTRITVISQDSAMRRFHQGLYYLLGTTNQGREKADTESFLAVVTVMAYLGAYVFPEDNLYHVRKKMVAALEPFRESADIEAVVEQATELAEVFRRPWSETPSAMGERTI